MPPAPSAHPAEPNAAACARLALGGGFVRFAGFDHSVATVHRALELGIRRFDTSVMYRSGASQVILGEALSGRKEASLIATKIGYFREARHFRSIEALQVQLQECLRLLRRDSVDLLQIHEADWASWWTDRSGVAPGRLLDPEGSYDFARAPVIQFLREAKANGLCRRIGITGNHARHLGRVIREVDGLDAVLVAYNYTPLNATARQHVIPAAAAKGMNVIVAGLFTFVHSLPPGWATEGSYLGPNSDRQLAALQKLRQDCGVPVTELALRFVAADQRINTLLVGACQPAEIEQNTAAFLHGPLPADLHAAIEAIAKNFP